MIDKIILSWIIQFLVWGYLGYKLGQIEVKADASYRYFKSILKAIESESDEQIKVTWRKDD